jgi:hypothetical protein
MKKISVFLFGFLFIVWWLLVYQKPIQAVPWGECLRCTDNDCCGSGCDTAQGYKCNNLGYGLCFCDRQIRWSPPTATPGPRPPAPTQPGGGGGGGGGPTPTGGYGGTESHPLCIRRSAINNQRYAISDKRLAIRDKRLAIRDKRFAIRDTRYAISDKRYAICDKRYAISDMR